MPVSSITHVLSLACLAAGLVCLSLALKVLIQIDHSYEGMMIVAPGILTAGLAFWGIGCLLSRLSKPALKARAAAIPGARLAGQASTPKRKNMELGVA